MNTADCDILDTIKQRKSVYGSYEQGTRFRIDIMENIRQRYRDEHDADMPLMFDMMIWDIVNKLSRLAVTPDHIDTVHDISGYANRYEEVLIRMEQNNAKSRQD